MCAFAAVAACTQEKPETRLGVTGEQARAFGQRTFFVDAQYTPPSADDKEAFAKLMRWCTSCSQISRKKMSLETEDIYPVRTWLYLSRSK